MNFSQQIRLKSKCYTRDSLEILTGTSNPISQLFDFGTCFLTFFFKLSKAPNGFWLPQKKNTGNIISSSLLWMILYNYILSLCLTKSITRHCYQLCSYLISGDLVLPSRIWLMVQKFGGIMYNEPFIPTLRVTSTIFHKSVAN